jgi:Glyoxalase/Bleomycin resistance protein/Dioxygenase superfamily
VNAADQFHVGIVVDDLDSVLSELTELLGYQWCSQMAVRTPVVVVTGEIELDLRFTYSVSIPRVEVIQSMPGTLWTPVPGSHIHHLGYWSDDVAGDANHLIERGYEAEATGVRPDGSPVWAYHQSPRGPRIELVSRQIQPGLEQYWAAGPG